MTFKFNIKAAGTYEVRAGWRHHENRASNAKVLVKTSGSEEALRLNMKQAPAIEGKFQSLGQFQMDADSKCLVIFDTADADGVVCTDFVQLLPVK